ncbi:MAG: restriction endonuclease subunit S [Selenomonadales bacterium]|nr:restriction endonuclease subunit S [Selenomonadales bacterium]
MVEYTDVINTDTAWLPQIPAHWKLQKIDALFTERKTKVSDKDYAPLSVTKKGILPQLEHAAKSNDSDNRKLVKAGDFVINSRSDRKGSCGVSKLEGSVSLINLVLTPRSKLNSDYVHYLLRNYRFSEEYYRNGRGIVADLWTTRYSEMRTILLPVPPRAEQDQIVRFLDWKVSEINKLISIRRKEIQELEELKRSRIGSIIMGQFQTLKKKSDISWVDAIPLSWKEKPLIQYAYERCIKNDGMVEDNLLSLSHGKVIDKDINTTDGLLPASFESYQIVEPGDIILRLTDLQNDHKSLRTGLVTQRGIITSAYTCLETRGDILPEFLQLELHVADLCKVFYGMGGGVRQSIGFKDIKRMLIAIPPLSEQHRILDLIHGIDAPTDKQKEQNLNIINELEELKKVIISDAVTGKIDVRNVTIPEYERVDNIYDDNNEDSEETETDGEEA